ncbi:hypothetical protein GA0115259_113801, partial [Streptomyces sp. MnatMP-M17]
MVVPITNPNRPATRAGDGPVGSRKHRSSGGTGRYSGLP